VKNTHFKCLVGCMYRPPNSRATYWDLVNDSLENAKLTTINNIYLLGDLNCDQMVTDNKLNQLLDNYHFDQLIKQPTHMTNTSRTCLDIIASTCPDLITASGTLKPSLSNHCPVYVCLKTVKPKLRTFKRTIWKTENVDWDALNQDLETQDWNPIFSEPNTDSIIKSWTKTYLNIVSKYIQKKIVTIRLSRTG
jgi:hypothetical protein